MVKRTWTALDGLLVFDFTINRVPHDGMASSLVIHSSGAPSEAQAVTITPLRPAQPFDVKFRSGTYVRGFLQQKTSLHIDGIDNTGIVADVRYGKKGQYDEHHFEGIMVACPTREVAPQPEPPIPMPITPD